LNLGGEGEAGWGISGREYWLVKRWKRSLTAKVGRLRKDRGGHLSKQLEKKRLAFANLQSLRQTVKQQLDDDFGALQAVEDRRKSEGLAGPDNP